MLRRKGIFLVAILALLAFISTACGEEFVPKGSFPVGTKLDNFTLKDLSGAEQSFDKLKGENGAVLVWLSAQCPVVKAYNERINQVADELKADGVNLIGINSKENETHDNVKTNASQNGKKYNLVIDKCNV